MAPDCIDSTVLRPITLRGSTSSTRRSAAARANSASRLMSMPGKMAPPRYSPLAEMASKVVAVPKSTTMVGPPNRSKAATASAIRSAPTSLGLS